MQALELFAGCGGLAKGLERAGFAHAGLVEFNRQACESLRANFSPSLVHEADVRQFDFSRYSFVDVVSGGPPCQPFSLGGLSKSDDSFWKFWNEVFRDKPYDNPILKEQR